MSYHAEDFAKLLGVSTPKAYYWIRKLGIDWRETDTYSKLVKACEQIKYALDNPTTRNALAAELDISHEAINRRLGKAGVKIKEWNREGYELAKAVCLDSKPEYTNRDTLASQGYYSISAAAKAVGMPIITLRLWLDTQRFPFPTHKSPASCYLVYDEADVQKLRQLRDERLKNREIITLRQIAEDIGISYEGLRCRLANNKELIQPSHPAHPKGFGYTVVEAKKLKKQIQKRYPKNK